MSEFAGRLATPYFGPAWPAGRLPALGSKFSIKIIVEPSLLIITQHNNRVAIAAQGVALAIYCCQDERKKEFCEQKN